MQAGEVVIILNRVNKLRVPAPACTHVHRRCLTNVLKTLTSSTIQTSRHLSCTSKVPLPLCVMGCADTAVCGGGGIKKKLLAGAESSKS